MIKKFLLGFFFLFALAIPAFATTYYASPSGGGAASCVDNTTNVCTLQRATTVAAGGTNTIESAAGTYAISSTLALNATNTGANLTYTCASVGACIWGASGSTAVVDIQAAMVSGTVTFNGITITDTDTDYGVRVLAPEVNVSYINGTINETDASVGTAIYLPIDTTNLITLVSGEDTTTGLRTGATTNVRVAQKIVPGANITVNRASFKLRKRCGNIGTTCDDYVSGESWDYRNGDTLTATIETDSAGAPSGTPVTNGTSGNVLAWDVPYKSAEWQSFAFASNVALTSGTTYWLVLKGSYTASASNYIEVSLDSNDGYAGGDSATWDGTTWTVATGKDYVFTIDRAHTRNLTVTGNTLSTRGGPISLGWADTITLSNNTITSSAGGILNASINNQWTTSDVQFKRIVISDNVLSSTTSGQTAFIFGVNTFAKTYTNSVIIKGNTGTISIFTAPFSYVKKMFIYGNNLEVQYSGNVPFKFGKEVDGVDPEEINPEPFDQIVIENNTFYFSAVGHNHLFLLGIGSEDGVFINNTIKAPNGSGASGGGWGIVIKADRWTVTGNKFYGPGPAIFPTSNHNRITYNTFETFDATGSNATLLVRPNQDVIYGGKHGVPLFNLIENNIFISNGTSWAAVEYCDVTVCATASPATTGLGRTEEFWSNRLDNNIYYAKDATNQVRIGAGVNLENVTLAEGIAVARTTWASSTYSDKNSISQYNDIQNSLIVLPKGIDGSTYDFTTSDPNIIGKGSISGTSIGGYQLTGALSGGSKMGISL